MNDKSTLSDMDASRLARIRQASICCGFLAIETLCPGDPFTHVPPFLQKVKIVLAKAKANP